MAAAKYGNRRFALGRTAPVTLLAVGALGLLAGIGGLIAGRRRTT
jgi:hypothetical protein